MIWTLSWQVSIVCMIIWAVSLFVKGKSPTFHYYLWCIVLLRLLFPITIHSPTGTTPFFRNEVDSKLEFTVTGLQSSESVQSIISLLTSSDASNEETRDKVHVSNLNIYHIIALLWFLLVLLFWVLVLARSMITHYQTKICTKVKKNRSFKDSET